MKNNLLKSRGFTLLEILLVVGIISLLAGIIIMAINPGKMLAKARDTQRKVGVMELNKALTQYYIDKGHFPSTLSNELKGVCVTGDNASSTEAGISCVGSVDLSMLVPTYLPSIPVDPSGSGYEAGIGDTGKTMLVAPLTEGGPPIIAIGTTTVDVASAPEVIPAATYTVMYDGNDNTGGIVPNSQTKTHDITLTLATNSGDLAKTGYTFSGWNTATDGSGTDYALSADYVDNANIILYAKWLVDLCGVSGDATDPDCWSAPTTGYIWGPTGVTTGASSLTDGSYNASKIMTYSVGNYPAVDYCDSLNQGGYLNWYLPSKDQLSTGLTNQFVDFGPISGFLRYQYYWTSTEVDISPANNVWCTVYNNTNGGVVPGYCGKNYTGQITRCIR